MLLLTLVMLVVIEAMYILSLKIPEWTPDYPAQGWMVSMLAREGAVSGAALLGLFWLLHLTTLIL